MRVATEVYLHVYTYMGIGDKSRDPFSATCLYASVYVRDKLAVIKYQLRCVPRSRGERGSEGVLYLQNSITAWWYVISILRRLNGVNTEIKMQIHYKASE